MNSAHAPADPTLRTISSISDALSPAERLRAVAEAMPADADRDSYGSGARIAEIETAVATLLGKETAVFSPSGKAVQNTALRVHADAHSRAVVAAHPRSHIVEDEAGARR